MAEVGEKAIEQLRDITECSICMSSFIDPRILPCIHTFCFECLKRTAETEQKKPGDKMPCPLCWKHFIIPADAINGVKKNFFMQNFLEFKNTLQLGVAACVCDMCNIRNEGKAGQIPTATLICLECKDNYCDSCAKVHQFQKISKDHHLVKIGSDVNSERKRLVSTKFCTKHIQKPLDYYCVKCKKIVCVSCFVESHASHECKDVTTVDKEFRETIEKKASKISKCAEEMMLYGSHEGKRKEDFLMKISERETEIQKRSQKMKDMIDEHTRLVLDNLSQIKSIHLKDRECRRKDIDKCCAMLKRFESDCTELLLTGSASDISSSVHDLIDRADELQDDLEPFIGCPYHSVDVSFQATNLQITNLVGQVKVNICSHFEDLSQKYQNDLVAKCEDKIRHPESPCIVVDEVVHRGPAEI